VGKPDPLSVKMRFAESPSPRRQAGGFDFLSGGAYNLGSPRFLFLRKTTRRNMRVTRKEKERPNPSCLAKAETRNQCQPSETLALTDSFSIQAIVASHRTFTSSAKRTKPNSGSTLSGLNSAEVSVRLKSTG